MAFDYYYSMENHLVISLALAFIAFVVVFYMFSRLTQSKGSSLIVGLAVGAFVFMGLKDGSFYLSRKVLTLLIIAFICLFVLKFIWNLFKRSKGYFGK